MLVFYKTIDKSVFTSGFAIPVMYKDMLFDNLGFTLAHGEKVQIDILIDDCIYKATLMNIDFDQKAHPNHKDILQVRYGANSPLAKKLREKFGYTESLINSNSNVYSYKWLSSLPEDQKEFMAIYSTDHRGVMMLDCITNTDFQEESKELERLTIFQKFVGRNKRIAMLETELHNMCPEYQPYSFQKESNPYTWGGIADGIAGAGAGVYTALKTEQENEKIFLTFPENWL